MQRRTPKYFNDENASFVATGKKTVTKLGIKGNDGRSELRIIKDENATLESGHSDAHDLRMEHKRRTRAESKENVFVVIKKRAVSSSHAENMASPRSVHGKADSNPIKTVIRDKKIQQKSSGRSFPRTARHVFVREGATQAKSTQPSHVATTSIRYKKTFEWRSSKLIEDTPGAVLASDIGVERLITDDTPKVGVTKPIVSQGQYSAGLVERLLSQTSIGLEQLVEDDESWSVSDPSDDEALFGYKRDAHHPTSEESEKQTVHRIQSEFRTKATSVQSSVDEVDCVEYADDIDQYLRQIETKIMPDANYMARQSELKWPMRTVLVEWMFQVHERFRLTPETMHLAVNLMDRFLSVKTVVLSKLQLVGATALIVASKFDEPFAPLFNDMVLMGGGAFQVDELRRGERYMVGLLAFNLAYPSPLHFVRRINLADQGNPYVRSVAKYLVDISMLTERLATRIIPSKLAAAAYCIALDVCNKPWTDAHIHYAGYTLKQMTTIRATLVDILTQRSMYRVVATMYAAEHHAHATQRVDRWLSRL